MIDFKDARVRNLKMKIAHSVIEDLINMNDNFDNESLKSKLYFKESDIKNYRDDIFEDLKIKDKVKNEINEFIEKYRAIEKEHLEDKKEKFKKLYNSMDSYFKIFSRERKEYEENLRNATKLAGELHFKYLPIYREEYIVNNGILPESNLNEFYNHFHAIEDLYREIFTNNRVDWRDRGGDHNLEKEMKFKVYTERWGHHDHYTIKRTIDGWYVEHLIANNGEFNKNGEEAFFDKLDHDSIAYPKEGVKYALETLWDEADTTNMSIEELQDRLNDIAKWIEEVEKATHRYQPSWCRYY